MPLSIFDRGDGHLHLMRADAAVGWIDGSTIGFGGFDDRAAALSAASIAYEVLTDWLARQRRLDAMPRNAGALQVRHDGAEEQLVLGDATVGRLLRRGGDADEGHEHAFELHLPPGMRASLNAAAMIHRALERRRAIHDIENALALA